MDFIVYVIILLIIGVAVGFLAGLLGVGGGFIMGPVQFWLLTALGIDPNLAIRVAFATSLAVIIPTAISGTAGHHLRGAVELKTALYIGMSGFIAAYIGGAITANTPADIIKLIFGVVIICLALWMLTSNYPKTRERTSHDRLLYIILGLGSGFLSGLLGVGGGVILIPFLVIIIGLSVHKAVGTSLLVIIFSALGGVLSYILNGFNVPGLPPYSLGYVNLLNLFILMCATVPTAQLGVRISHQLPAKTLKYIYVFLMIYIGLKMIGVFEWLNLPI